MNNLKNAWLVRPCPDNRNRLQEFQDKNIVAVGWPGIGSLSGKSRANLKQILSGNPYNYTGLELGNAYATVDIFVNQIKPGSLVLVPYKDDIYFAEITGGYSFDQSVDSHNSNGGYPHQRTVKWLENTSRKNLSKELRSSLKVRRTAANFSKHFEEIDALAHGRDYNPQASIPGTINVSYPLRPGCNIDFTIPDDITKDEARRLSSYLASLYFAQ